MKAIKIGCLALLCFVFTAFIHTPASADDGCAVALEKNCISCHQLGRVCEKLGKKNEKRWKRTIKRMIKRGAKISKKDRNLILKCLNDQQEGALQVCK